MAVRPLPDGGLEVTDDTGTRPPVIVPANLVASLSAPPPLAMPEAPPPLTGTAGLAQNVGGSGGVSSVGDGTSSQGAGLTVPPPPEQPGVNYSPGPGDPLYDAPIVPQGGADPSQLVGGSPSAPNTPSAVPSTLPPRGGDARAAGLPMTSNLAVAEATAPKGGGYSPGHPGGDVVKSFQVQRGAPELPPELQEQAKNVYGDLFSTASGTGTAVERAQLEAAKGHLDASQRLEQDAARMREEARARENQVIDRINAVNAHIGRLKKVGERDVVSEYWASKGPFHRIGLALSALGAGLLGSTTNPLWEQSMDELNAEVAQQRMKLDSGNATTEDMLGALAQMRATFTSPDAAEAASKAILMASLEQQALALAGGTASAETQGKYMDLAGQYSKGYLDFLIQAHQAESDRVSLSGVRVPAQRGGYSPARKPTYGEALNYLTKKLGYPHEQAVAMMEGYDAYPAKPGTTRGEVERENFEKKSQVVFDDGTKLYANPEASVKLQQQAQAFARMRNTLGKLKEYTEKGWLWKDLPTQDRARLKTAIQFMTYDVKEGVLKEALNANDREFITQLTGETALDKLAFKPEIMATFDEIGEQVTSREENLKRGMYLDPGMKQPYAGTQKVPDDAQKEF